MEGLPVGDGDIPRSETPGSSSRSQKNSTLSLCSVETGAENAPVLRNTTFCDYLRFVSNCCDKPARRLCVVEVARGQRSRPPLVKLFLQLFTEPPTQRGRDERYRISVRLCIILALFFRHCCFRVCESAVGAGTVAEHFQGGGGHTRAARPYKSHFFQSRCCFSKATASPTCSYIFSFFSAASLAAPCQSA